MRRGSFAALALVLLLSGCGHERAGSGSASLWITRDRGKTVLLVETVPAGLTAMEALDRKADISKRYGGRYVQSIEGIEGDSSKRRDWFWFLNGIEADRSAADYRLRPGDVEWWDFRSWSGEMRQPVVVGAFPEPFLHGWDGKVREVAVRYAAGQEQGARAIGRLLHARTVRPASEPVPAGASLFSVVSGPQRFTSSLRDSDGAVDAPVQFVFAGDAAELAREPAKYRFRYSVP